MTSEFLPVDWESLAKRLIAANQLGLRFEQDSGHRWIFRDNEADFLPACLAEGAGGDFRTKQYGSYKTALDHVDEILVAAGERTLLERFSGINYYDDLGVIFGDGVQ